MFLGFLNLYSLVELRNSKIVNQLFLKKINRKRKEKKNLKMNKIKR